VSQSQEPDTIKRGFGALTHFPLCQPSHVQRKGYVAERRHVREECIVLKHDANAAFFWRKVMDR
jgi:hypothetical protein